MADWVSAAGEPDLAAKYRAERSSYAKPFRALFSLANESKGEWVDALEQAPPIIALGLGPDIAGAATAAWLINDIESTQNMHATTGSVATRFLYPLLSSLGRTDLAATIAASSTFPSPGYWLTLGATTCWEDYSGVADDTHPPPPTHNHPFLCSHGAWFYDFLLGLRQPDGVSGGYTDILAAPPLLTDLRSMAGSLKAGSGTIVLSWAWNGVPITSDMQVNISVPPAATAFVRVNVPGVGARALVLESGAPVWQDGGFVPGVSGISAAILAPDSTYIQFTVASGVYAFTTVVKQQSPSHSAPESPSHSVPGSPLVHRVCAAWPYTPQPFSLVCPDPATRLHFFPRAGFVAEYEYSIPFPHPQRVL